VPLLDGTAKRVVGYEHLIGKLCPSPWARVVRCEPALNAGALVAVTVGTVDGVAHDLPADRAQEGWEGCIVHRVHASAVSRREQHSSTETFRAACKVLERSITGARFPLLKAVCGICNDHP
jgi:hypothetical protein